MEQTLREWVSDCNMGRGIAEFGEVVVKYADLKVVKEYHSFETPFPQTGYNYRNVNVWALMEDGSAFGWNESPRTGWTFARIGKKTVTKNMK